MLKDSPSKSSCASCLVKLLHPFNILDASQEDGAPLMDVSGHNVQNATLSGNGLALSMLHKVRHREALQTVSINQEQTFLLAHWCGMTSLILHLSHQ